MSDLRKLWRAGYGVEVKDIGRLEEYGLCVDRVAADTFGTHPGYWRYQISWGGPAEEFRYYDLDGGGVEFWFLDWGDGAPAQTLVNGAGSTFDYPAFTKWFEAYGKMDADVRFNYQSIGSGGGLRQLIAQTVDFGASDAPMSDEMMKSAPGKVLHFPVVVGGEAVAYNLPGNPKLKLDAAVVSGIYLGNITKWNDPKIAALNPGVALPDLGIVVVHRSDGSGTTFIFTDYLSSVNPAWADTAGKGTSVKWPAAVGIGAKGNEGVAGQVKQLAGAIGYVELAYARQNQMTYADLKNAAGNFVAPDLETVSAAMATAKIPDDFRFSIVNAPGDQAYPIAGASWVII
jgi:phosphate transport system substrate-binding protein